MSTLPRKSWKRSRPGFRASTPSVLIVKTQQNLEAIQPLVEHPVLPKKGRRNQADRARESTPEFKKARKQHALIESRINCLEHHGGDRVRTKAGKDGFARTVAASVVATNLCQIGKFLMKRDQKRLRRAA